MTTMHFHYYDDFTELSTALVKEWLAIIDQANSARKSSCSFALAGGSTPAPVYRLLDQGLAQRNLYNSKVKLVATDERWVADADPQSNEGLFQQCMAQSYQKQWQLVSLKNNAATPEAAIEDIDQRLRTQLPANFDAVLLGMGTDGHVASLFPGGATQQGDAQCLPALHPQTQQSRMSLSLPRLVQAERIWLVITGAEKRHVLESALEATLEAPQAALPIAFLVQAASCPIDVFWCP
jgi:6-phosphogluconolactonase